MATPTLVQAIATIRSGRRADAYRMLTEIISNDPNNILAWLWMVDVCNTVDEQRECLRQILALDPNHAAARQKLEQLDKLPHQKSVPQRRTLPISPSLPVKSEQVKETIPIVERSKPTQKIEREAAPPLAGKRAEKPRRRRLVLTSLGVLVIVGVVLFAFLYMRFFAVAATPTNTPIVVDSRCDVVTNWYNKSKSNINQAARSRERAEPYLNYGPGDFTAEALRDIGYEFMLVSGEQLGIEVTGAAEKFNDALNGIFYNYYLDFYNVAGAYFTEFDAAVEEIREIDAAFAQLLANIESTNCPGIR